MMESAIGPRLDHLRRLTDPRGLIRSAVGDCPDRFSGYATIENADALRLCATASDSVDGEALELLARTYMGFLSRGRRYDSGVHHFCDASGTWTDGDEDDLVQSRVARALSAVVASKLPMSLRMSAADWWRMLIDDHAEVVQTPVAAANWLIGLGQLRAADPGRDIDRADLLASWLVEECYYPVRSGQWDWFEPDWTPGAAVVPAGLWYASKMLAESRFATAAEAMTRFVIDNLFSDDLFWPVGNFGGWSCGSDRAMYDQSPGEVVSVAELLCIAERISGSAMYGDFAACAAGWFTGKNIKKVSMVDDQTGGCFNSLKADGVDPNQGASAILSYLSTKAALSRRPAISRKPPRRVSPVIKIPVIKR